MQYYEYQQWSPDIINDQHLRIAGELLAFAPQWYPPQDSFTGGPSGGKYVLACLLWELYGDDPKRFVENFHAGCIFEVDWIIQSRRWPTAHSRLDRLKPEYTSGQMMFLRQLATDSAQFCELVQGWSEDVGK